MNTSENELEIRRTLGTAMITFVQKITTTWLGNDEEDAVMRQVATEEYRQVVEDAARHDVEAALAWHTLAIWTELGKERIGYFSRALECCLAESRATPRTTARDRWADYHTRAECLFEIGRVHFHEGAPDAAREFLTRALPLAQQADALRSKVEAVDDRLEGRIAELLLRLPDENNQ
jgi:hypothetical protein